MNVKWTEVAKVKSPDVSVSSKFASWEPRQLTLKLEATEEKEVKFEF